MARVAYDLVQAEPVVVTGPAAYGTGREETERLCDQSLPRGKRIIRYAFPEELLELSEMQQLQLCNEMQLSLSRLPY